MTVGGVAIVLILRRRWFAAPVSLCLGRCPKSII